jgi:hypothetical protein
MVMKRSSARRARRWVIQKLARDLDRPSDTAVTAAWSSDGKSNEGRGKSSFNKTS